MSTVRIDLSSTDGRVDRTRPSLLQGRMTETEWAALCLKLEQAVKPAVTARWVGGFVFGGLFLVTVIIIVTSFIFSANNLHVHSRLPIPFIVVPILWATVILGYTIFACRVSKDAMGKLRRICEEESSKNTTGLSFHLKEERLYYHDRHNGHDDSGYHTRYYLEIMVNPNTIITPTTTIRQSRSIPDVEAFPVVTATPVASAPPASEITFGVERTTAARLAQLNQEYEQKRQEILEV